MSYFKTCALLLALVLPGQAFSQTFCADRDSVVSKLEVSYGEVFAGGGLQNSERIYEVWFSEEKGTWTILMTRSDGKSCIMASGTNWREGNEINLPKGIPG